MSDRWASLLANAADPASDNSSDPSFIEILKQLSPVHARILEAVYDGVATFNILPSQWNQSGINAEALKDLLKLDESLFRVGVENLVRLRLVAFPSVGLNFLNDKDARFQLTNSTLVCATHLGQALVTACQCGRDRIQRSNPTSGSIQNFSHRIVPGWS